MSYFCRSFFFLGLLGCICYILGGLLTPAISWIGWKNHDKNYIHISSPIFFLIAHGLLLVESLMEGYMEYYISTLISKQIIYIYRHHMVNSSNNSYTLNKTKKITYKI